MVQYIFFIISKTLFSKGEKKRDESPESNI